MDIVAKSEFNFQGNALVPVANLSGVWLTSADIANALQYKSAKSITNLFNQNADEFTSGMTQVIESVTSGNYRKKVRVFSLRGAHLIAMFARTSVAKEFRRWVLDILDREVGEPTTQPLIPSITQEERDAYNINVLVKHYMVMFDAWRYQIEPALRRIESPIGGRLSGRFSDGYAFLKNIEKSLNGKLQSGQRPGIS